MLISLESHAVSGRALLAGIITACALGVGVKAVNGPTQPNVQIESFRVYPDPQQMPVQQQFMVRLLLVNRTVVASDDYVVTVLVGDYTGGRQFPVCLYRRYAGLAAGERNPMQFACHALPDPGQYHIDVLVTDSQNQRLDGRRVKLSVPVFTLSDVSIRPTEVAGEYWLSATVGNNTPELADRLNVACEWACPAGLVTGGYAVLVSGGYIRAGTRFTYSTPFRMQCEIPPRELVLSCAIGSGRFRHQWRGAVATGR